MQNPYDGQPNHAFWRRAVSLRPDLVDPVVAPRFRIAPAAPIAMAGTCFAQPLFAGLATHGFTPLVTEDGPAEHGFGIAPARFGNLYSPRQLHQLFRRAYALFRPVDEAWRRPDGALVDPFRPQVHAAGFADLAALRADRVRHLAAVRRMFEGCDVFFFVLGLTEAWVSGADGAVFPLPPGVVADAGHADIGFHNFTVPELVADLGAFVADLRVVNPGARVVLALSPVSLIATFEDRHVMVATGLSKARLRLAAEEASLADPHVAYFPAFEILTGAHAGAASWEPDLRQVSPQGIAAVLALFARHYLASPAQPAAPRPRPPAPARVSAEDRRELGLLRAIHCDAAAIDR